MALLPILHFPDPKLRNQARPVEHFDESLKTLVNDMYETMYHNHGIGLAATQVNIAKQVLVIDISEERNQPFHLINPQIIQKDGVEVMQEGCLSVPGVYESVTRAQQIKVTAVNIAGEAIEIVAEGLLAVCIQHEIDHLQGKLFIDYLSPLKRQRIQKKLTKQRHYE